MSRGPGGLAGLGALDAAAIEQLVGKRWLTSYDAASRTTGQTTSATRGAQRLEWRYDGFLLLQEKSVGPIAGVVDWGYDNFFRVATLSVNGSALSYGYDDDGLLASAGSEVLVRLRSGNRIVQARSRRCALSLTLPAVEVTRVECVSLVQIASNGCSAWPDGCWFPWASTSTRPWGTALVGRRYFRTRGS